MNKDIATYYAEICPDCDGWELRFSNEEEDGNRITFTATCRDCGSTWEDFIDVED